ncbi:MAG TPA: tRNA (adenosine(37)-N6)-dimethylallyltransferase MiaA [Candidatus Bathyarchaeia archaeon]|nr:tRNA (adenosine(37)-N6)-dimethylallyltransferase MiaA [Candidatus Bathyarchaeia archaeon]
MYKGEKKVYVICGPTGVGKTAVSLAMGNYASVVLINMDMGQLYVPLTIGTAKPLWQYSGLEQRMFDVADAPQDYGVMQYRQEVEKIICNAWHADKIPVLVGGSLFYLKSLLYPLAYNTSGVSEGTWQELHRIDPVRAACIHPHDTYRIHRALGMWKMHGTLPSACKPTLKTPWRWEIVWVHREREELYARIEKRVVEMVHSGWQEEAETLRGTPWEAMVRRKNIIGYADILDGGVSEDVIVKIAQKTRNYAKRQMTYWRGMKKAIEIDDRDKMIEMRTWNLTNGDIRLYLRQLWDTI